MPILPDTKNWTWVLTRPCPECGFDAERVPPSDAPRLFAANAAAWPDVLARPDARMRPDESTWSPLEYAAHVRDVFRLYMRRLELALHHDDPEFADWDQDATAVADRYGEQDPERVRDELLEAADAASSAAAAVRDDQWDRPARRSDGSRFTVGTLTTYIVHDPVHHLWDVTGRRADAAHPLTPSSN